MGPGGIGPSDDQETLMMRSKTLELAAAAAVVAAASVFGTGIAGASPTTTARPAAPAVVTAVAHPTDDVGPRLERACLRIPNLQLRTDNLLERLRGDATVRGSLAWLQTQIDAAAAAGRTQLVTVLENRLAVRTATIDVLVQRQAALVELAQTCDELLGQG